MAMIFEEFVPKIPKYECDACQYITGNKKDYNKHILTRKHLKIVKSTEKLTNFTNEAINGNKKSQKKSHHHICSNCNKVYITSSGLWRHNKICTSIQNDNEQKSEEVDHEESEQNDNMNLLINLFQEQLKENKELKELIIEDLIMTI